MTLVPKVHFPGGVNGGDSMKVESGGSINIETGGEITGERIERKIVSVPVASVTAGAAGAILTRILNPALAVEVKRVALIPSANCAGHATNNFTISLRNVGTGATEAVEIASLALTTGNALTANVGKALTLATANDDVTALQNLVYAAATGGTGIDVPPGTLVVEYVIDPS